METLSDLKLTDEQVQKLIPIIGMYEETTDLVNLYTRRVAAIEEFVQFSTGMPYVEFAKLFVPNRLTYSGLWPDSYNELPEMPKE